MQSQDLSKLNLSILYSSYPIPPWTRIEYLILITDIVQIFVLYYNLIMKKITRKSNTFRCFKVLECLKKYTNEDNFITTNQVKEYLYQHYNIEADRKTIYADIKTLEELEYTIEHSNSKGFALSSNLFDSLEIKILSDAISTSNFLDKKYRQSINDKLFSLINHKDAESINKYEYLAKKKSNDKTKYYLSNIIEALKNNHYLILDHQDKIIAHHLHRFHDRYYLIYQYQGHKKVYFKRVDRIRSIDIISEKIKVENNLRKEEIINAMRKQVDMFQQDINRIHFKILENDEKTKQQLIDLIYDEFDDVNFKNNDEFIVNGNCTPIFYSHLIKFGNKIKIISPKETIDNYITFLKNICNQYK